MTNLLVETELGTTPAVPATDSPMAVLAGTRSFKDLDRQTLEVLVAAADTYRIAAGTALFSEGEPFGGIVFILYDGDMRQYRSTGFHCDVHRGDFLALANYVDRSPFASTVKAFSDCVVLGLAAGTLEQLERNYPSLFNCLNRIIAHKLRAPQPGAGRQPRGAGATGPDGHEQARRLRPRDSPARCHGTDAPTQHRRPRG